MVEILVGLVVLLPLLATAWIALGRLVGLNRGESGEGHTSRIARGAASASLLSILILDGLAWWAAAPPGQLAITPWLTVGGFRLMISFTLDWTSLAMATVVGAIFFLNMVFSVHYMHREEGFQRFFAVLCLFMAAMLLMVLAGNLMMMFVGWELAGLSSYLLIGYAFDRATATDNATRAFVTNRFGDAGFVVAMALALFWTGSLEWPELVRHAHQLDTLHVGLVMGGLLLASLAKSAQFPFAAWIHRALEGPTPSSAIFYGALMVHAGVFLLIRTAPLLSAAPILQALLFLLGLISVVYGGLVGLVQTDIKSALLFSTQTQVGLMFMACGLGWFDVAFLHMLAHAAWRTYLFLIAPSYMHLVQSNTPPRPQWIGRWPILYPIAVRRLWLDSLGEMLLTRPTQALGRDMQIFDERVVDRLVGKIQTTTATDASEGAGMLGHLLERVADGLHWFEERLLFGSDGGALFRRLLQLGRYLELSDHLLGQPRYLLLIIVLTFTVIL